jgi:uncharacterized membrane protein
MPSATLGRLITYHFVQPLVQWLPVKSVGTVSLAFLLCIAALLIGCFLAGLFARTAISRWFVGTLEQHILAFVPSYGLMKSMGQGWIGVETDSPHRPVLVRLDDAAQIGFVMDTFPDNRNVVFIPGVPAPWSGSLLIVAAERLEAIPLSTRQTIDSLRKLGADTSKLLAKVRAV